MRPISDFGFVKATEVRNILFYGLLPCLQQHLCIQRLSHMALFVCAVRLFHCDSLRGSEVVAVADELLISYYRDHEDYYTGLQNFVLHLHSHYSTIYTNYGALSNLGCFGQEDLIGNFSSNHNGTRYYGELICHYYNIDFSLNRSGERKERDGPIDPSGESPHQAEHAHECHRRLCGCNDLDQCIVIYRRCIVREQLYHSLIYHRSPKSISYFVQYSIDDSMDQVNYGAVQCFVTFNDKPFALMRHHPMKQLYSDHFKSSKYYRSLKEPLDYLFHVLEKEPCRFDVIGTGNILRHCVVFDRDDYLVVTAISAYNEHDWQWSSLLFNSWSFDVIKQFIIWSGVYFLYICYPVDILWTIVFAWIESKNELCLSSFQWTKYFLLSRLVHLNHRRHCLSVSIMAFDPRGKRTVKRKAIYSPSDPSRPEYHLIHVQELQKDFIVKTSSIKQQTNGNVSISVGGEDKRGQLITSGMYCSFDLQWRQWTRRWKWYTIGLLFRHQSSLRDRIQLTITWCGTRWDGRSNRFWRKCNRRLVKVHSFF